MSKLADVHADLAAVVRRAAELCPQVFVVHDGLRSTADQQKHLESGASRTLDSRHVSGHAVDLVPSVGGELRWEWEPIYVIAVSVRQAAKELGVPMRWGGAWDIAFTESEGPPHSLCAAYGARRRDSGNRPFFDGSHYELSRTEYP